MEMNGGENEIMGETTEDVMEEFEHKDGKNTFSIKN